jgi:hypothetical protein
MRPDWCVGAIVPACNEAASIEQCIDSILEVVSGRRA